MKSLQFTRSARKDLERLRAFIAKKNPSAARRISQRLKTAITRLVDHPELGVMIEEIEYVRDLVHGDYVVRYTLVENKILILRIWHGKENR